MLPMSKISLQAAVSEFRHRYYYPCPCSSDTHMPAAWVNPETALPAQPSYSYSFTSMSAPLALSLLRSAMDLQT